MGKVCSAAWPTPPMSYSKPFRVTIRVINPVAAALTADEILGVQINQAIEDGLRAQYVNQTSREGGYAWTSLVLACITNVDVRLRCRFAFIFSLRRFIRRAEYVSSKWR